MDGDDRIVWTYYAYRATQSFGFWVPVGILYLDRHEGYGLDVIGLANAGLVLAIVLSEVPAGYLADRVGRRASLAVSNGITAVVMGLYAFLGSGTAYVALFTAWGVGFAFQSAIGEAWLYDLLADRSDADEFARTSGRGETAELLVSAGASVLSAALYAIDPVYPFAANAVLAAAGLPLLAVLPATRTGEGEAVSIREILGVLRAQARRPEVRWLVGYVALFNALFSLTRWLEQPAMAAVGVPVAGLGVLYAAFRVITAIATANAGRIHERVGPRGFFLLMAPVVGVVYASVAVLPLVVVPVIVLRRVLGRLSGPIRNQYINDRLDGFGRATVLSGVSMVLHLASGVSNAVAGHLAETTGPVAILPVAGVSVAVAAGLLWATASPVRPLPAPSAAD